MPATRTSATRLATAAVLAPLLATAAFAGPAQAQEKAPTPPPAPSTLNVVAVPSATIAEGTAARLAIPLSCRKGKGSCTFRVGTLDGTATAATDYAARGFAVVLRPGQSKTVALTVKGLADTTCEPEEAFSVQVQSQRGRAVRADLGQVVINRDADVTAVCAREAAREEQAAMDAGLA